MTPAMQHIIDFIPRFLHVGLELSSVHQRLDAPISITPNKPFHAAAIDGMCMASIHIGITNDPNWLLDIEFNWEVPIQIALDELESKMGKPTRIYADSPEDPDEYAYSLVGYHLYGIAIVRGHQDASGNVIAQRITLRRLPPEPYPFDNGRAVRFVVLADLLANVESSPRPWDIGKLFAIEDVDELLAHLQPSVRISVPNCLSPDSTPLEYDFQPTRFDDLMSDVVLRTSQIVESVIELRQQANRWKQGRLTTPDLLAWIDDSSDLSDHWRRTAQRVASDNPSRSAPWLIDQIDEALSRQYDAICMHEAWRRLVATWCGLAYLTSFAQTSQGAVVDVVSTNREHYMEAIREEIITTEQDHPEGLPPTLILVDQLFWEKIEDRELLTQMERDARRIHAYVVSGASPEEARVGSVQRPSADTRELPHVITCQSKLLLRPSLDKISFHRCFDYRPSHNVSQTAVWGNGIWGFGAIAARSLSESGRMFTTRTKVAPPIQMLATNGQTECEETTNSLTRIDVGTQTQIGSSVSLRASRDGSLELDEHRADQDATAGTSSLADRLSLAVVRQTIRRIHHLHAAENDAATVSEVCQRAISTRMPNAPMAISVSEWGSNNAELVVELGIKDPSNETLHHYKLTTPWIR